MDKYSEMMYTHNYALSASIFGCICFLFAFFCFYKAYTIHLKYGLW